MGNGRNWAMNGTNKSSKVHELPLGIENVAHVAGFPHLIEPRDNHPEQIYSRTLFPSGHGFPLWLTSTNALPDPYKTRPPCIGDVGYLNEFGSFRFAFNLFLPPDAPLHKAAENKLPPDYAPLEAPNDTEMLRIPAYFPPGAVIASKGVNVTRVSESPLNLKFDSSEPECAFLILPEGASREDITSTSRITEYLQEHALSWIQHFHLDSKHGYITPNGSLYIITGCDKAKAYAMAAFPMRDLKGSRQVSAQYMSGKLRYDIDTTEVRSWDNWPVPFEENSFFIRGIRLALNDEDWNLQFNEVPRFLTPISVLPPTPPISDQLIPLKRDSVDDEGILSQEEFQAQLLQVQHYPFHLSNVISQIMLFAFPHAELVIISDNIWSIFQETNQKEGRRENVHVPLTTRCLHGSFISDCGTMIDAVFRAHKIVEIDGALFLVLRSKTNIPLITWMKDLRNRLFPKPSREPSWVTDLILDLVRQGESIRPPEQKFQVNY